MVKNVSEIKKIVKEYKDELKKHKIHTTKMILFGSYANGHPKPYSDIDLVVISPDLARFSHLKSRNSSHS